MPIDRKTRFAHVTMGLGVKATMRRARDTPRMDDRESVLNHLMYRVSVLPPAQRQLAREAALFTITMGHPSGEAVRMAVEHLEKDINRPRSPMQRLMRALEVGGATEHSPLQDRIVELTADLFRQVTRYDPDSAEEIARAAFKGESGILASKTFIARLRNTLGPNFTPDNPASGTATLRRCTGQRSTFGQPPKITQSR